jgi:CelD/BcsL family acetyltransferase involved in cellulose biosynthesis
LDNEITIAPENFDSLASLHSLPDSGLNWNLVFTLPAWLKVWWQHFGNGAQAYIRSVKEGQMIIGLAPLQIRQGEASIIGSVNVCDYQDCVVVPGKEMLFYSVLLDDLLRQGAGGLHLETIRPDSSIALHLLPLALERQYPVEYKQVDVSADMPLAASWEDYLAGLDGKQRHELKRKMRNLGDLGESSYFTVSRREEIPQAIETFLQMFPESRGDKAQFMTGDMAAFFRDLSLALAETGILRFGTLKAGDKAVAMIMYFDYNEGVYLYNSAYDPAFKGMSVGVISKARCIQGSILQGKKRLDFLKGPEQYKSYLGGKEIPLYSCHITLK